MTSLPLRSWFRLSRAERRLALEAALLLAVAWPTVRLLSFRLYGPMMGRPGEATFDPPESIAGAESVARGVGRALRRADRHLPWHSTCLMRALAGQIMLRRRRCPGTVYVGVERREEAAHGFHAWLLAGAVPVTGAREASRFIVIATFR